MHALQHIRPGLTDDVAKTIASALVGSRLDYDNAVLVGVSDKNIRKLQRTQKHFSPSSYTEIREKRGHAIS